MSLNDEWYDPQEFLSSHIKSYFSKDHGYFIGLQKTANTWVWIDGHNDTLR